ncbi:MAG TPA: MDR family MFS transporter [Nocardioides sp.]|jgi:DHA2 family lincomycin resistance protein-like MFS transporter
MSDQSATPAATTADYGVLRWLVAATFIVILNETVMFNALPSLRTEFDVSLTTAQWLSTAFMLTMAVVIPVTGWFLQRVTTRQAFGTAMAVFCTGTLLAAVAPTFPVLLAARIVQGSGTAVMMPLLMTTLMTIVAPQDRGRIMGNVTLAMSVAPALGPTFSGLIIDNLSWRWMFGLVLPIAGGIAVVGLSRLRNVGKRSGGSVHVPSMLVSAIGFGSLVYGLSQLGNPTASHAKAWAFVVTGVVFVAVFALLQLRLQRTGAPLLDLRTLGHRTYRLGLITMAAAFAGMFGSMLILPTYLQGARELTPFQTGLLTMPGGLAMGLLGPRVGRWFDRFGARRLVVPGGLGMVLSLGILTTQISLTTPIWLVLVAHVLMMVSLALVFTPVFTLALGDVPPHLYSHASSLLGTLQQVAGAMGVAIVATLISARTTSLVADGKDLATASVGAMTWAFGFGAILAVVVLALLARLPNRPATPPHGAAPDDLLPETAQSS